MALCFIDLDDLKTLNDTHRHRAGDSVLRKVGSVPWEHEMKYEGIFGHYGGDEFIFVLNGVDTAQKVHAILSELVEKLNFSIAVKQKAVAVHCSIGTCTWNKTDSLGALATKVDKALYDVKRYGKKAYPLFLKGEPRYEVDAIKGKTPRTSLGHSRIGAESAYRKKHTGSIDQ